MAKADGGDTDEPDDSDEPDGSDEPHDPVDPASGGDGPGGGDEPRGGDGARRGTATRRAVLRAGGAASAALVSGRGDAQRAPDLTVEDVEVTQAIQHLNNPAEPDNSLPVVRGKRTFVRAYVGVSGASGPVPGVDGLLRVFVGGSPLPRWTFASENGPISAPTSPDRKVTDHTLNFQFLVPEVGLGLGSGAVTVDLEVEVNHDGRVAESDRGNNTMRLTDVTFECHRSPSIGYVPINYTYEGESDPGETGLPDASKIDAGDGDDFIWHTFPIPEPPNYFRLRRAPVDWDEDVDETHADLLNQLTTVRDMRDPQPDFVYGWLPGNPFECNGISAPGTNVAFGNTEDNRYRRTFAHEIVHLLDPPGKDHNKRTLSPEVGFYSGHPVAGIRVDNCDTTGTERTKCRSLRDVMDAGRRTRNAWIDAETYDDLANDDLISGHSCPPIPFLEFPILEYYFITGTIARSDEVGTDSLNPVYRREGPVELAREDPEGTRQIELRDEKGNVLFGLDFEVSFHTADSDEPLDEAAFALAVPVVDDRAVASVVLLSEGEEVARIDRTPNSPQVEIRSPQPGQTLAGQVPVRWAAADGDDDPLVFSVQYSPDDGETLVPLTVNTAETGFELDTDDVPGSDSESALLRVIATDGLNTTVEEVSGLTVPDRKPPTVRITEPTAPEGVLEVRSGRPLILSGHGYDPEDGFLTGQRLQWESSRDGHLGTGRTVQAGELSVGQHVVTLVGFDSDQNRVEDSVTVVVVE